MFTGIVLSDFHLAASKLEPKHQYDTLKEFFYPHLRDKDVCIISGDFFDTSLLFDHEASIIATTIMTDISILCKNNNIPLRILRGTFSHDRDQLKQFATIASHYSVDYKYFDVISVDKIKDKTFIYFPDTLPYKSISDAVNNGYQLLKETYNAEVPNIVIGHGYFKHRIPNEKLLDVIPHYSIDMFRDCELVLFGHEHIHWNKNNVYSVGSFDRLNHGEEAPKGFMTFSIDRSTDTTFIENKLAIKHITIEAKGESVDEKISNLCKEIENKFLNKVGYLRIRDNTDDRLTLVSLLKDKYPELNITSESNLVKSHDKKLSLDFTIYHYDVPTIETIDHDLLDFVKSNFDASISEKLFNKYIKEIKDATI